MRFVIVSILPFTSLISHPNPKDHCTSYLLSFAYLDQAGSEILVVHLPPPPPVTDMSIWGTEGWRWCPEGTHVDGILPPHPLHKAVPRDISV